MSKENTIQTIDRESILLSLREAAKNYNLSLQNVDGLSTDIRFVNNDQRTLALNFSKTIFLSEKLIANAAEDLIVRDMSKRLEAIQSSFLTDGILAVNLSDSFVIYDEKDFYALWYTYAMKIPKIEKDNLTDESLNH
jgi:hypothetical protein